MTGGEGLEATLMKMLPAVRGLGVPHQRESAQHTINKTIIRKEERGGGSSLFQRNEPERGKGRAFLILSQISQSQIFQISKELKKGKMPGT